MVEFVDYIRPDSGCELAKSLAVFKGIWRLTNEKPCLGCGFRIGCSFLEKILQEDVREKKENFGKVNFKTNAQVAKEKGISKRQASKLRRKGGS